MWNEQSDGTKWSDKAQWQQMVLFAATQSTQSETRTWGVAFCQVSDEGKIGNESAGFRLLWAVGFVDHSIALLEECYTF